MKAKILIIIILLLLIMAGIVHDRVVASRDKGMALDWNADHNITGDVDMDQHSWENQVIENLGAFPGGPVEGQVCWRADLNHFYIFDGTNWKEYALDENIGIRSGTHYWSCPGTAFSAGHPDVDDVFYYKDGFIQYDAGLGDEFFAPVVGLPDGAIVTAVIVYGNAGLSDENWFLRRIDISAGTGVTMANTACNSEDTSISHATIDNNNYAYMIYTTVISASDRIYGARIRYTL